MSYGDRDLQRIESWGRIVKRLGDAFTPLDEDKIDVYYDRFKFVHITILHKAADVLIDQHPYRRFPLVAEFWKAIAAVKKTENYKRYKADAEEQLGVCPKCKGEGFVTDKDVPMADMGPNYFCDVARFCSCKMGARRGEAMVRILSQKSKEGERVMLDYKDEPTIETEVE